MASLNQIAQWTQSHQSEAEKKRIMNQLKLEGANMLKDIYEAILHLKDYSAKLIHAVSEQSADYFTNNKIVLREDCKPLNYFCQCLERVLLFGIKKKFFRSSSIWSFIFDASSKCFSLSSQFETDIKLVQSIESLNDDGKARAFLRQSLRSRAIPLYFELILRQSDVVHDYYWEYGVIFGQKQTLLAQLDELNFIDKRMDFQMLLSDKSLNIMQNFEIDSNGVPQWNVSEQRGDIATILSVWLLRNRESIGIDVKIKKKKHKHKKLKKSKHSKRKLNNLVSTDELRQNSENGQNIKLQIDKKENKKKRKKKKTKKKKKENDLLKTHPNVTVVDDSEIIQNILEKEKLQQIEDEIATLNIEDIIDEHVQCEKENNAKKEQPQKKKLFKEWFQRNRSSSLDELHSHKYKMPKRIKPNNFIQCAANRNYEIMAIRRKKNVINIGSMTPPPRSSLKQKSNENRRYLTVNKMKNISIISQSSSPTLTMRKHKIMNNEFEETPESESEIEYFEQSQNQNEILNRPQRSRSCILDCEQSEICFKRTNFAKPKLSKLAKQFMSDIESVSKKEDMNEQIIEISQERENDEYDTDEDTEPPQVTSMSTYYNAMQYEHEGYVETINAFRRERDEALKRSAMLLDDVQLKKQQSNVSVEDEEDVNDEKQDTFISDEADDNIYDSPIPKEAKDRYSSYMTRQYLIKKRIESEDLSHSKSFQSPSTKSSSDKHTVQNGAAMAINLNLSVESNEECNGWNGIEISWRTTPLPPRNNAKLLVQQNYHCATCGTLLQSKFLRKSQYHYCRYTGLIHCNLCHQNERAIIPHRVLHELDCRPDTVCCAAKRYLDRMYNIPCIALSQFGQTDKVQKNKKIKQLTKIMYELTQIKTYLDVCRDQSHVIESVFVEYRHWIKYAGSLSLRDCVNVISFNTVKKLQTLSNKLQKHIRSECDMCRAKGFYCEICGDGKDIIYSFEYLKVSICDVCKACFHSECWQKVAMKCPRCIRRQKVMPHIK